MQVFRKADSRDVVSVLNELIERANADTRRLRLIEQNSSVHKTRINMLEKDLLVEKKAHMEAVKKLENVIEQQNIQVAKMENYIKEIVTQLKKSATKSEIGGLEELVDLFNPLTSKFMTKQEVARMIKDSIKR